MRLNNNLAVKAFFSALARRKPRLLVLEDLHWADGGSTEATAWLAKAARQSPMVLLLLYRPSTSRSGGSGYEPPKEATEIVLSELPVTLVEELLAAYLGEVPEAVARMVTERADGNPFYVEELVRHLLESGILEMSGSGYALTRAIQMDDLPPGIENLIAARLDRLNPDARDVAAQASVIGRSFLLSLLSRLTGRGKTSRGIAQLVAHEVVFQRSGDAVSTTGATSRATADSAEYIFKHALTRDVAYAGMLVRNRRRAHAAVAKAIEDVFRTELEDYLAMLGHHWEQAGKTNSARACYLAGAKAARTRYAHAEAEHAYRAYLRLVKRPTEESVAARCELVRAVLQVQGRMRKAESEALLAIEEARAIRSCLLETKSLATLGSLYGSTGRMEEGQKLLNQALANSRDLADRQGEGDIIANIAGLYMDQGKLGKAHVFYKRALAIVRDVHDKKGETVVLGDLGCLLLGLGRLEEARHMFESALATACKQGMKWQEGRILGNLACLYSDQENKDAERDSFHRALRIAREVGDRRSQGAWLLNLAIAHVEADELEESVPLYKESLAIARELCDRQFEGRVLGNLAALRADQGREDEARRLYEQALSIAREVGDHRFEGIWMESLATRYADQGRTAEAEDLYKKALTVIRDVGDPQNEGAMLCNLGRFLFYQGRMEEVRADYERALTIMREVGNRGQEGILLIRMASMERVSAGDLVLAANLAARAEACCQDAHSRDATALALIERAFVELAAGRSSAPFLQQARNIASEAPVKHESELKRTLPKLERAQAAFEAGEPLVCGQYRKDLTEGQLRWVQQHRLDMLHG